ncbi:hypothetical protein J7J12_01080, partial [bacterium]|nr:hypothetical protein [bacterium]
PKSKIQNKFISNLKTPAPKERGSPSKTGRPAPKERGSPSPTFVPKVGLGGKSQIYISKVKSI